MLNRGLWLGPVVVGVLVASLMFVGVIGADDDNGSVQIVKVHPFRCLPLGDFSGVESTITVPSNAIVLLQLPWVMTDAVFAPEFLENTERLVFVGGQKVDNEADYWATEVVDFEYSPDLEGLVVLYWVYPPVGPLAEGQVLPVHWEATFLEDVDDGAFVTPAGSHPENDCTIIWGEND